MARIDVVHSCGHTDDHRVGSHYSADYPCRNCRRTETAPSATAPTAPALVTVDPAPYIAVTTTGPFVVGVVIANPNHGWRREGQPDYLVPVRVRFSAANEDNDDFADTWIADCRAATADEAASLIVAAQARQTRQAAVARLRAIAREVVTLARQQGTLTNDSAMPAALLGTTIRLNGQEALTVAGGTLESRSRYTIDVVNHSAVAVAPELAREAVTLIAAHAAATIQMGA